jgi:hypothetical protein
MGDDLARPQSSLGFSPTGDLLKEDEAMQVTDTATAATLAELQRDGLLGEFLDTVDDRLKEDGLVARARSETAIARLAWAEKRRRLRAAKRNSLRLRHLRQRATQSAVVVT